MEEIYKVSSVKCWLCGQECSTENSVWHWNTTSQKGEGKASAIRLICDSCDKLVNILLDRPHLLKKLIEFLDLDMASEDSPLLLQENDALNTSVKCMAERVRRLVDARDSLIESLEVAWQDMDDSISSLLPPAATDGEHKSALDVQVGGDHYKGFAIQPVEFIEVNKFGFLQGCIIKRIARYNRPGGKGVEDLEKIKHEADLLIELGEVNG